MRRVTNPLALFVVLVTSWCLTSSCSPTFVPATLITDARVLAIVAEPPESTPGGTVTLTPLVVSPAGTSVVDTDFSATWWRCPSSDSDALGDFSQCTNAGDRGTVGTGVPYRDVVPTDIFGKPPTTTTPPTTASATTTPGAQAVPSARLLGALLGYWRVVGLTMSASGHVVDGFKREPVYLPFRLDQVDPKLAPLDTRINAEGQLEPDTNPVLTGVIVHEDTRHGPSVTTLKPGRTYFIEPLYDDRTLQAYFSLQVDLAGLDLQDPTALSKLSVDELLPRFHKVQRCEIPVFSWYATGGHFEEGITLDEHVVDTVYPPRGVTCPPLEGDVQEPAVQFRAPSGKTASDLEDTLPVDGIVHAWVVMRDGRGGTAATSFTLKVAP